MFPMNAFLTKDIGPDPYAGVRASLRMDDLPLKQDVTPKLSLIVSVFHRYSQLQRTLETLCRQTFKDFDVLIFDNDDDQNLPEVVAQFDPYLHITYYKKQYGQRHFDPSLGIKTMLPHARGQVIAIAQPECMLREDATYWLYYGHFLDLETLARDCTLDKMSKNPNLNGRRCVTFKTMFSSPRMQPLLDDYNWHDGLQELENIPNYWDEGCGLSYASNRVWLAYKIASWWFVQSYLANDPILENMPVMFGHASIDMYMISYRRIFDYLDIMPLKPLSFHQDHHRMSFAPEGEVSQMSDQFILDSFKEFHNGNDPR